MASDLQEILCAALQDHEAGWSMGSFGAIAEFHQDQGEALLVDAPEAMTRATSRGAIRIDRGVLGAVTPVAYEALSPRPHRWSHALALCLPETIARRQARKRLTPLGPDAEAIREEDRGGLLYDMGLGLTQCDFCIRTADPELIGILEANAGRSLFDPGNPAIGAILPRHPHRVALTNLGRAEVYQKIGGPDTGGVSPAGPHTHLLPRLLRSGRTHSANVPIPGGLIPCAYLHPGHPVFDTGGRDRPFALPLHEAFQVLFERFAHADLQAAKQSVLKSLQSDDDPSGAIPPSGRYARASFRVAIRQAAHVARVREDLASADKIARWRAAFDAGHAADTDDEQSEHDSQCG